MTLPDFAVELVEHHRVKLWKSVTWNGDSHQTFALATPPQDALIDVLQVRAALGSLEGLIPQRGFGYDCSHWLKTRCISPGNKLPKHDEHMPSCLFWCSVLNMNQQQLALFISITLW